MGTVIFFVITALLCLLILFLLDFPLALFMAFALFLLGLFYFFLMLACGLCILVLLDFAVMAVFDFLFALFMAFSIRPRISTPAIT